MDGSQIARVSVPPRSVPLWRSGVDFHVVTVRQGSALALAIASLGWYAIPIECEERLGNHPAQPKEQGLGTPFEQ